MYIFTCLRDRHTEIYFSGFKFAELEMSASCKILPIFPINSFHRACSICAPRNVHILSRIQRDRMGYERPCGPTTKDSEDAKRTMPLKLTIVGG